MPTTVSTSPKFAEPMPAKVFIGCSAESKDIATRLTEYLQKSGFTTLPWFYRDKFRGVGNVTLWNNLVRIASGEVQKAVFIFAEDDLVLQNTPAGRNDEADFDHLADIRPRTRSIRDFAPDETKEARHKPRDNVLMEYGLFVGKLGIENVVIMRRPGVVMPSDLAEEGMSHRTFEEVAKTLRERGDVATRRPGYSHLLFSHPLVIDLCRHMADGEHAGRSRYLYSTRMGAIAWRAIERETKYQEGLRSEQLNKSMHTVLSAKRSGGSAWRAALLSSPLLQVVSYGPGVGLLDRSFLTTALPNKQIEYVPVDISVPLLSMTIETMKGAAGLIRIPFAVHGDFEDGIDDIMQMLRSELGRQPKLHLMLGGTFANIEKREDVFLRTLGRELGDEDLFLLDVFSKQPHYNARDDPFCLPRSLGYQQRVFLAIGVAKVTRQRVPEPNSESDVDSLLDLLEIDVDEANGASSVPGTTTIRYRIKDQPGYFFSFRRYSSKKFVRYLAESAGFAVEHKESFPRPAAGLARSVYVLRRRHGVP